MRISASVPVVTILPVMVALALLSFSASRAQAGSLVGKSPLTGLVFEDQPQRLEDKGAFRDVMNKVAADSKRACGSLEIFGWEVAEDDQSRVDSLEKSVKGFFKKGSFTVREARSGILWNADADAFTADADDTHILALLTLSPSATRERTSDMVLLLCAAPLLPKN